MKTVLVFAGTTEGRKLVEAFDRSGIPCHVCVATEYGSQVLKTSDCITVHTGRLDEAGMKQLAGAIGCQIIVDATHPYAVHVTESIRELTEETGMTYLRLLRANDARTDEEEACFYENVESCVQALAREEGRILLTTGSKQLSDFTKEAGVKERIIARVIPGIESIRLCYEAGLEGNQIIAMQGPFSREMNESILREYGIKHLVTKESGVTGGTDAKYAAAKELGIKLHIIKRPMEGSSAPAAAGLTMMETINQLEQLMDVRFDRGAFQVVLAGIGPGGKQFMTKEAEKAIHDADVLFGAQRMLDSVSGKALKKYPYYRKEEILPILESIDRDRCSDTKAVILFSGDTGFYSGCKGMYEELMARKEWNVKILPGISSISLLCARVGLDWQDGAIVSLHGTSEDRWSPVILDSVKHNKKTFFITSGVEDVRKLGNLLGSMNDSLLIQLGYQLSYPEERLFTLTPSECTSLEENGLYCGVILSKDTENRLLVPVLEDDDFLRDQVPMTKEEIRKLSICQMRLKENDTVYDIGCGSGSIAVQAGALSPSVKVFAIECNPEAVNLTRQNVNRAKLTNVRVLEAMAPEGLEDLPPADVAFVGGSKGNLEDILWKLYEMNPKMRVVMNAVSMETICEMNRLLRLLPVRHVSVKQVSVSRAKKLGEYHLLSAGNPVFIFSFEFRGAIL